jgi:DNA polymerase III delta subunit
MKPQLKTWYKHRGSLFFVYPIHIEEFYDESGFVVDYIEVYVKDDKIYAWISNYSTNSLFASRLYKITNPRLIPRE